MIRFDKDEAVEMLRSGKSPSEVSKIMKIPLSTVTSWSRKDAPKKPAEMPPRERIKATARMINTAEAKIMTAASEIVSPSVTDKKWFEFQETVTGQLKSLAIQTAGIDQQALKEKLEKKK